MKKLKIILSIFPLLFLVENIFGYNGTIVYFFGKAIRHWLYLFTFISLFSLMITFMYKNNYGFFSKNKKNYFKELTKLDYCILLFLFSLMIWMTIVPLLSGGDLALAKREAFDAICMLVLYFPTTFLIKNEVYSFTKTENIIYYSVFIESVINISLYIGESFQQGFITKFFGWITTISPSAVIPPIILGHGNTPRVLFTTSILLFVGIFICIKKIYKQNKLFDYVILIVHVLATIATMTKSFWYGFILSFLIICIIRIFIDKTTFYTKKMLKLVSLVFITILVSNFTIFDNSFFIRMNYSFTNNYSLDSQEIQDVKDDIENEDIDSNDYSNLESQSSVKSTETSNDNRKDLEQEGAMISNDIKIEQTSYLIKKWKQHPVFGFGFGSYCEDYLRSQESIFSYEMTFPALLMKQGVVGILFWILCIVMSVYTCFKKNSVNYSSLWLFSFMTFGIAVQTNPFIFSFTGFFVLIYFFISAEIAD